MIGNVLCPLLFVCSVQNSTVSVVRQEVSPFIQHSESYNNRQEHDPYLLTERCEVFRLVLRVQHLAWRWSLMCVQA